MEQEEGPLRMEAPHQGKEQNICVQVCYEIDSEQCSGRVTHSNGRLWSKERNQI